MLTQSAVKLENLEHLRETGGYIVSASLDFIRGYFIVPCNLIPPVRARVPVSVCSLEEFCNPNATGADEPLALTCLCLTIKSTRL